MGEKDKYKNRIVLDTRIHFGKPCVANTRIPIEDVLELVQENIPFLEIEDIQACVVYATELVRSEEIHVEQVH
jgi:uncharacterized protein (DUF433 family)